MPFKVTIKPRDACISEMICVALCLEVFEISLGDGRAAIKSKWRVSPGNPSSGRVSDDLEYCVRAAAENCPVEIILVEREEGP